MEAFIQGFIIQAGLIMALGAQNLYVIDVGLQRKYTYSVAALCSVLDFVMVMTGVLGAGYLLNQVPMLKIALGLAGAGFLAYYGLQKYQEFSADGPTKSSSTYQITSRSQALKLALGFTVLNPHVYLDAWVLIGGYAGQYPAINDQIAFGLGASGFSTLWFFSLVTASSFISDNMDSLKRGMSLATALLLGWLSISLAQTSIAWGLL